MVVSLNIHSSIYYLYHYLLYIYPLWLQGRWSLSLLTLGERRGTPWYIWGFMLHFKVLIRFLSYNCCGQCIDSGVLVSTVVPQKEGYGFELASQLGPFVCILHVLRLPIGVDSYVVVPAVDWRPV